MWVSASPYPSKIARDIYRVLSMAATNLQPKNILQVRARLGEGPVWDAQQQQLYWVDIYNRRVHSFDPASGEDRFFELDTVVSALSLMDADRIIVAQRDGLGSLNLATGKVNPLVAIEADRPNNRLNDLKCDPRGRLWVGTMNHDDRPEANLYRYDLDGSLQQMETGLAISNGLGWSPDGGVFYLTDTPRRVIYAYDYDLTVGEISNRRPLIDLSHQAFHPDGLTVDAEGCIWSAMWNGGCVVRFDPEGREMLRVRLPVPLVTCCTFGGPDLSDLYITTASVGLSQKQIQASIYSGDVFWLPTEIRGLPAYPYSGR